MNRKLMAEIILDGGVVTFDGRVIKTLSEIPSLEEIRRVSTDFASIKNKDTKSIKEKAIGTTKGKGRIISIDPRDANYPLKANKAADKIISKIWETPKALDQKLTSECVAYSGEMLLIAAPVKNKQYKTPTELYKECQKVDEIPGEDLDGGTTVRALMKVLKKSKYIKEYHWGYNIYSLLSHVLVVSPVVVGTTWYWLMEEDEMTDDFFCMVYRDYIPEWADVPDNGGHAYVIKGADRNKDCPDGSKGAFRCINSWGTKWGDEGEFWVSFNDMNILINEPGGEAAAPIELKVV